MARKYLDLVIVRTLSQDRKITESVRVDARLTVEKLWEIIKKCFGLARPGCLVRSTDGFEISVTAHSTLDELGLVSGDTLTLLPIEESAHGYSTSAGTGTIATPPRGEMQRSVKKKKTKKKKKSGRTRQPDADPRTEYHSPDVADNFCHKPGVEHTKYFLTKIKPKLVILGEATSCSPQLSGDHDEPPTMRSDDAEPTEETEESGMDTTPECSASSRQRHIHSTSGLGSSVWSSEDHAFHTGILKYKHEFIDGTLGELFVNGMHYRLVEKCCENRWIAEILASRPEISSRSRPCWAQQVQFCEDIVKFVEENQMRTLPILAIICQNSKMMVLYCKEGYPLMDWLSSSPHELGIHVFRCRSTTVGVGLETIRVIVLALLRFWKSLQDYTLTIGQFSSDLFVKTGDGENIELKLSDFAAVKPCYDLPPVMDDCTMDWGQVVQEYTLELISLGVPELSELCEHGVQPCQQLLV